MFGSTAKALNEFYDEKTDKGIAMDLIKFYDEYEQAADELSSKHHVEQSDLKYNFAVQFIHETNMVSISKLQRALRIGYNQAARIVERMELEGLVTKPSATGGREVIATK